MSFTDVVYGGLGQVNNQFQANLGQNAAMNQNQQASMAAQQAAAAAQQAQLANLYGPQGFGGQTAYYAGQGAAYGRATGGFGGGSDIYGVANPSGTVTSGGAMPGYQLDPTPDVGAGGGGYAAPTPGEGGYNPFDSSTWSNPGQASGGRDNLAKLLWKGTDSNTGAPPLGGGPDYGGAGQYDPNSFANRFGAGGYYNPGKPAQQSGVQPGGYDPFSGAQPPYTYQPGMVQGMGGPGDWVRQQIPGMQTLTPNDAGYRPMGSAFDPSSYGGSPFVNLPGG